MVVAKKKDGYDRLPSVSFRVDPETAAALARLEAAVEPGAATGNLVRSKKSVAIRRAILEADARLKGVK